MNADLCACVFDSLGERVECIELLKSIRAEMTGFKGRNYLASSIHSVMREF